MDKFRNKYRISSSRLKGYDYSQNGAYFITVCTRNRVPYFAELMETELNLTELGEIALSCWHEIPQHFPFVKLGPFIVMPDHIHGVIIIKKDHSTDLVGIVETENLTSLQYQPNQRTGNRFGPQSRNLASVIRGYKVGVSKKARQLDCNFSWQSRYFDHIIQDEIEYQRIYNYIMTNHEKWLWDHFQAPPLLYTQIANEDFGLGQVSS